MQPFHDMLIEEGVYGRREMIDKPVMISSPRADTTATLLCKHHQELKSFI